MDLINDEVGISQIRENTERGQRFVSGLLLWNRTENRREMPWKREKDPYKIWISEIILQQTRVEQAMKYYENFISVFPDLQTLAAAPDEKIFKCWEGLGYYSRCRNLIWTARHIQYQLNGRFPTDYEGLLKLKGIGTYTAAAIASFAYNLPHAVLDGNVLRVLSRIFGDETPVDSIEGKNSFTVLAQSMLPSSKAGAYNQAIMDFGATICKPSPVCGACFFNHSCTAFLFNLQNVLPIKEKKPAIRERWFHYFLLVSDDQVAIRQRTQSDIWQGLFEFFLIEKHKAVSDGSIFNQFRKQTGLKKRRLINSNHTDQKLTHQLIHFKLFCIEVDDAKSIEGFTWINKDRLHQYAFPRTLQEFVKCIQ